MLFFNRRKVVDNIVTESVDDTVEAPQGVDRLVGLFNRLVELKNKIDELSSDLAQLDEEMSKEIEEKYHVAVESPIERLSIGPAVQAFNEIAYKGNINWTIDQFFEEVGTDYIDDEEMRLMLAKELKDEIISTIEFIDDAEDLEEP